MSMSLDNIMNFPNIKIDPSIINQDQIKNLVFYLLDSIENNIEGDVAEFGCYVGESTKYLMKTLVETQSDKKLFVYDSFEGLPPLSKWEEGTGWKAGTLKSTEEILISNFEQNNLPIPIIHKDWFKNVPEEKIPEKISFAFLDGDFYDSIYDSLNKVFDRVIDGGYICFHDYQRNDLPGVRAAIEDVFKEKGADYTVEEVCEQLGVYRKNKLIENRLTVVPEVKIKKGGVTIVTGIWDIKRDELSVGWNRNFDHYLNHLAKLMKTDDNMIIFIEEKHRNFVESRRNKENTLIITKELEWFKKNGDIFQKINAIRLNPEWYNQSSWLVDSTQARLEMYNPLVMSKMFLLNDAAIMDPFDSSHLVWIDGAITNTVHDGYFWHDKVTNNIQKNFNKFTFVCFPYDGKVEIHGFTYGPMCEYAQGTVDKVARGGIFGGPKEAIEKANGVYYDLLNTTLNQGYMGTEESIFTIMLYKHPELFQYYEIGMDGLLGTFFENLKNGNLQVKIENKKAVEINTQSVDNTALYVIAFNFPKQFETLCKSFEEYDRNFLDKPKKFLLNNSTDRSSDEEFARLCTHYGFTEIKKDNIGICGGRQFCAEHAEENRFDFHFFFEDDMFFYNGKDHFCRNGFRRIIPDFYNTVLHIAWSEQFDFLKWNFSEFFGDNRKQWAWHNIPATVRESSFPDNPVKEDNDVEKAPFLNYRNIKSHKGLPYATGEVYYCNWPQVVSREGNKKMFLKTKWAHPYEQTWMSYIFQETRKGSINPGILLATPTEHNRFEHYSREERREN